MAEEFLEEKRTEFVSKLKEFLHKEYYKDLVKSAGEESALNVSFKLLDKFSPELGELLLEYPKIFFELAAEAVGQIELPKAELEETDKEEEPTKIRVKELPSSLQIRDLRAKHVGKFISTEGVVRKATEIRPEIVETLWECSDCGEKIHQEVKFGFVSKPFQCPGCRSRSGFKRTGKKMIDTRRIVIEEPFETVDGERPSQVNVILTEDLVCPESRSLTNPGNRLKITGVLKEIPIGKSFSSKLDFYLDSNHVEPTEIGWEKVKISKKDEDEIKALASNVKIYESLIDSVAPSLYGMREIKESIILQLFGGMKRILKDRTKFRGDIHILLIGDPASGKSQLMKLVPTIMPRGRYVSGKGVTGAGLTATVTKDEFMGGWVLEAGAMVLTNKGMLAVDEFEKMSQDDQVAMHEALEQGSVSIAKASIMATLPAETSVLAGGNPKFSRFDPYIAISKQINIPETLLSRFDLKFALRDIPNAEQDTKVVDHVLKARETDDESIVPQIDPDFVRKYIAYAKGTVHPRLTKESGKMIKDFYIKTRKKAEGGTAPIPITLRQFESLIRLSEASAKVQLSPVVRKEDAQRAIRLMKFSLMQLGFDYETGQIDIDKTEAAVTSTDRSKIRIVMDIINELSERKKEILVNEIEELSRKEGVDEADKIVERLKREGMLFEPSPGYVQKV